MARNVGKSTDGYHCGVCPNGTVIRGTRMSPFGMLVGAVCGTLVGAVIGGALSFGFLAIPGALVGFILGSGLGGVQSSGPAVCMNCGAHYNKIQAYGLKRKAIADGEIAAYRLRRKAREAIDDSKRPRFGDTNTLSERAYRYAQLKVKEFRAGAQPR